LISNLEFLAGGGDMGERIRSYPWSQTPLGIPDSWPQGLRTTVRMMLTTRHPILIFWGAELTCLYNDAFCRSLGPEKHPAILGAPGRGSWEEVWPVVGAQIEQVLRGDGAIWFENQLVPIVRYGKLQEVYWTYSYTPIDEPTSPHGVGGVLVICSETTEHVMAEHRLKAERERFVLLFDQAPTFLALLHGPSHIIELANPGYLRLVGDRQVIGRTIAEALPEAVEHGDLALLDEVYQTGKAHTATAARFTVQIDSERPTVERYVDLVYQPITDVKGEVTGILVQGVDSTDRTLADRAVREADLRKDEFLAMLAHELRNPLAPIRSAAEVISRTVPDDGPAHATAAVLVRQVAQLTRLVDDLLDVSRISRGHIPLKPTIVELHRLLDMARETVAPVMHDKQHQLVIGYANTPIYVNGDAARLLQVFSNVLTNAAKYTDSKGHIEVRVVGLQEDSVTVEITDNGAGIPPELLPRIFDLFMQADRTLDRAQGGLGVGLSVVKKLVEMHGGHVTAQSAGLGRGSTFSITLPRSPPPSEKSSDTHASAGPARRILIIDDNVDGATVLAQMLSLDGHKCEAVFSATEGLERARTYRPDVILLDIGLPTIDGYEVARRLRENEKLKDTLLLAMTGYDQPEDRERALSVGFDEHFVKPMDLRRLKTTLAGFLPGSVDVR
jgi:signal transduction histidine kinase/ActR/RegA family two-component response regulator